MNKIIWQGKILGIQPRIRLLRSFDESNHSYLGYNLSMDGIIQVKKSQFSIAIGKGAQAKFEFEAGNIIQGYCEPVNDSRNEVADYYKVSKLEIKEKEKLNFIQPPPWFGPPVELPIYRERGHRRLAPLVYSNKCKYCIWGCKMPVEIIVDHWNPGVKKYRFETFCYGPKSCSNYKPGPTRKVPGRKGMVFEEEDWVDEETTRHRGDND